MLGKYGPITSVEDIGNMGRVRENLGENKLRDEKH
jgi:hypothetical protein